MSEKLPAIPWKDLTRRGWGKTLAVLLAGWLGGNTTAGKISITLFEPELTEKATQLLNLPEDITEFQSAIITAIEEIPAQIPATEVDIYGSEELQAEVRALAEQVKTGVEYMERLRVVNED